MPRVNSFVPLHVTYFYGYSLPLEIGSDITLNDYNAFLDRHEKVGYKFRWNNGVVTIIEMTKEEHGAVVSYLFDCFKEPNNGVRRGLISVLGSPCKRFILICLVFGL